MPFFIYLGLALGCWDANTLTVAPPTLGLTVDGALGNLNATVTGRCGQLVQNPLVSWVSRTPATANVLSDSGTTTAVTGLAGGTVYIVASDDGGGKDSALVTVTGAVTCVPTATHLCPGDNVAAKVTAQASGTAFTVGPGTFANPTITAKANMTFTGTVTGGVWLSIFDGGKLLTGWTQSGSNWFVGSQTQGNAIAAADCQPEYPGCIYPEQLWVNDSLYEHVTTLGAIGTRKWFFDYTANQIYLPFNPTDSVVRTSVTLTAVTGNVTGVTVKKMVFQHYATSQTAAVVNSNTAGSWTIDSNIVRNNGGSGIAMNTNGKIRWNKITHSGQMGYKINGSGGRLQANEIAWNNTNGFGMGTGGQAGGGKAAFTTNLMVDSNWSHHNDGPGLWTDIDNTGCTYYMNTVDSNRWRGIFHEISYDCIIRKNTARYNGYDIPSGTIGLCDGAGIIVSSSENVTVDSNTVLGNRTGICAQETNRPKTGGNYDLLQLQVSRNTVTQTDASRAGGATDTDAGADAYSVAANNDWFNNTYTCVSGTRWQWNGAPKTKADWLAAGQDVGSTFSGC